jgi:hypothetical protein
MDYGIVLDCQICFEDYDIKTNKPLVLDCGHSICRNCLRSVLATNRKCPFDKVTLTRSLDSYPINWAYIDIIGSKLNVITIRI